MSNNITVKNKADIRILSPADAEEFRQLRLRALTEEVESFGAAAEEEFAGMSLSDIENKIKSTPDSFILGIFEPNLIGMLGFYRQTGLKARHKGILWGMYIAPESRGKGLGRKLVQEAILRASSLNELKQLILAVVIKNTTARALYLSLGFKSYGMEPASLKVGEEYLDDDMMILRLEKA